MLSSTPTDASTIQPSDALSDADQLSPRLQAWRSRSAVRAWGMSEIPCVYWKKTTGESYREVRLAALQESPEAFVATYAEEATQPESTGETCMVRADRLLAERDGVPLGVASR